MIELPRLVGLIRVDSLYLWSAAIIGAWCVTAFVGTLDVIRVHHRQLKQPDAPTRWKDADWIVSVVTLPAGLLAISIGAALAVALRTVVITPWTGMIELGVGALLWGAINWAVSEGTIGHWLKAQVTDWFRRLVWTLTQTHASRRRAVELAFGVLAKHQQQEGAILAPVLWAAIATLRAEGQARSFGDFLNVAMLRTLEKLLWIEASRRVTAWPWKGLRPARELVWTLNTLGWEPPAGIDRALAEAVEFSYQSRDSLQQTLEQWMKDPSLSHHEHAAEVLRHLMNSDHNGSDTELEAAVAQAIEAQKPPEPVAPADAPVAGRSGAPAQPLASSNPSSPSEPAMGPAVQAVRRLDGEV